jgi:hypothetical protein
MENYARECSITGEGMNEGWCFNDGEIYCKYEHDAWAIAHDLGYDSIDDAFENDACYWTEFETEED